MKPEQRQSKRRRKEMNRIWQLARQIKDQSQLNLILMEIPNRLIRREVFHMLAKKLTFEAEYPIHVSSPHVASEMVAYECACSGVENCTCVCEPCQKGWHQIKR